MTHFAAAVRRLPTRRGTLLAAPLLLLPGCALVDRVRPAETVTAGETLKLTTPTMDAGTTFEISVAG